MAAHQRQQHQQQQYEQTSSYSISRPSMDNLNNDILLRIFDYLHFDDKIRLRRTCPRWRMLLDVQIDRVKAIRLGEFTQGGYNVTSGLTMKCREHHTRNHRQQTGSLYNNRLLNLPADLDSQCYSINHYDYLHRTLKYCHNSITMLSLGRIKIPYRLLIVITHNLPNLEHLELIGCASDFKNDTSTSTSNKNKSSNIRRRSSSLQSNTNTASNQHEHLPSMEVFNSRRQEDEMAYSQLLYNQHHDEQKNMEQRLMRSCWVRSCELVKLAKSQNYWPNLKHLLVKECHLLNEFSLSIILAITNQTLNQLTIESNQYLTGEFLNYCGPKLQILQVKHCPLFQVRFLEDLVKIRQFLNTSSPDQQTKPTPGNATTTSINRLHGNQSYPQPINNSMLRNYRDSNQAIYCSL